jgi:hypothetical protein
MGPCSRRAPDPRGRRCTQRGISGCSNCPFGSQLLDADRAGLTRYLWKHWSPGWTFSHDDLATVIESIANPDWAAVVAVSAYEPWDVDPNADPQDAQTSRRLALPSALRQPTLNLSGARDTVDRLVDTQLGQAA